MSTNVSSGSGGKRARPPKHQNAFAYKHNPSSTKTEKILAMPNVGLCQRCHDQIEWRKKYRKYKPRTVFGTCHTCHQKNVKAAYHTLCTDCARKRNVCAKCEGTHGSEVLLVEDDSLTKKETYNKLQTLMEGLPERKKRTIARRYERGDELNELLALVQQWLAKIDGDFNLDDDDDDDGMDDDDMDDDDDADDDDDNESNNNNNNNNKSTNNNKNSSSNKKVIPTKDDEDDLEDDLDSEEDE